MTSTLNRPLGGDRVIFGLYIVDTAHDAGLGIGTGSLAVAGGSIKLSVTSVETRVIVIAVVGCPLGGDLVIFRIESVAHNTASLAVAKACAGGGYVAFFLEN